MFKPLYGINFIILIYAIKANNWPLLATSVFIFFILGAWYLDHLDLITHKAKQKTLPSNKDLHIQAQQFIQNSNMSWYQKIISIRAFIAGAQYILNKFK